jgi:NAD(P)-dependent dehydrogenase (short-subunit alcohol dehydrogenase family)
VRLRGRFPGPVGYREGGRMQEFEGRVAVVTGAASGIGSALAARAASEGMHVALADVDEAGLRALAREIERSGARCLVKRTDVSRASEVEALADAVFRELGGVHLLFNNAGVLTTGLTWERPASDWEWVLGVNLWGVIHGIRSFVPRMIAQQEPGHVVNTASVAGLTTGPLLGPYTVTKHAVVALSETLHHELALTGSPIRASVLCPGEVRTGIMDAARNRPKKLASRVEPNPAFVGIEQALRESVRRGLEPDELADEVFQAIREERFWILTHPEFKALAEARVRGMVEGRNPVFEAWRPGAGRDD